MRIVIITEFMAHKTHAPYGGVDWRERNIASVLGLDNEVYLITSKTIREADVQERYNIIRVGSYRNFTQSGDFLRRLFFIFDSARTAAQLRPDVIMGSGYVSWPAAKLAARKSRSKAVSVIHEIWQEDWIKNVGLITGLMGRLTERQFLKGFDGYICVSETTFRKLLALGIDASKVRIITNGVDFDLFDKIPAHSNTSEPYIICICRLVSYKRVSDLISASKKLLDKGINHKLVIIGEGPARKDLERLANQLGISKNIEFKGKIDDRLELIRLLKGSSVFALPSISEGMGIVIAEAIASRVPYVAADIPAIRETTFGGKGGFLFRPLDIDDLAEKLHAAMLAKVDESAYLLAKEKYDWSEIGKQTISFIRQLVEGGN